ncbi:MAG: secretin N-terminal domain-containing protein, partial [Thermodesulfobacteriota bacterium]
MRRDKCGRIRGFWILWGVVVVGLLLTPTMDARADQPSGKGLISVNFQDTDLRVVIEFISELTGKNFIVDSKVKGRVTAISPTKITVEEAYRLFESILEVEGYTTVPADRFIKIVPAREARLRAIDTITERKKRVLRGEQFVTRIMHLNYIDADSVTPVIKPLISRRESSLVTYSYTNDIILTDTIPNIRKILSILRELDVEGFKAEISVLPLQFTNAKELATELHSIFEVKPAPPRRRVRRRARRTVPAVGTRRVVKLIPDDRTNSIVLVANVDDTIAIKKVIRDLDIPAPKGKGKINVYYL